MSEDELSSFLQCLKIFYRRKIILVTHDKIELTEYIKRENENIQVEFFDQKYFLDISGYNQLLLSISFYKRFVQFKYILIYQLDSWIFKDDLDYWCDLKYDYIGAPWVDWFWSELHAKSMTLPRKIVSKLGYKNFNLVGNGGFSLRNVHSCLANLKLFQFCVSRFKQNEDYFFSFFINSYNPFFRVSPLEIALKFSFDENPQKAFELNNNQLPMGCHAWHKYPGFWNDKIK